MGCAAGGLGAMNGLRARAHSVKTMNKTNNGAPVLAPMQFGMITTTPAAAELLGPQQIAELLSRHFQNDWGSLDKHDTTMNRATVKGVAAGNADMGRVHSSYAVAGDKTVWIISYPMPYHRTDLIGDINRCNTTVMLPSDY